MRTSGAKAGVYQFRNQEGRQRRYVVGPSRGGAIAARRVVLILVADVATGADHGSSKDLIDSTIARGPSLVGRETAC
jgi:hypothetical protein